MNTDDTQQSSNILHIEVNDPDDYNPNATPEYTPPSMRYSAGPPASIVFNRRIPVGELTEEHIVAELHWIQSLESDLENLELRDEYVRAVLYALINDIRQCHPETNAFSHFGA